MELALLLFLVILATELVNLLGKTVLIDLAFSVCQPLLQSSALQANRTLKRETLEAKRELDRTSSQDEFSKWAKLRRKLDKLVAELEKSNAALSTTKDSFARSLSSLLWLTTTGAQLALVWWYRSSPVFYLPKGYLPGIIGWWFSLPFAPKGSISSAAWSMVCKRTIKSIIALVKDLFGPAPPAVPQNPFMSAPPAAAGSSAPASTTNAFDEKSELRQRSTSTHPPQPPPGTADDLRAEDLD